MKCNSVITANMNCGIIFLANSVWYFDYDVCFLMAMSQNCIVFGFFSICSNFQRNICLDLKNPLPKLYGLAHSDLPSQKFTDGEVGNDGEE